MSTDWKPGDVALVEAGCWVNRKVALRLDEGWAHTNGVNVDDDGVVSPIRPLVVIDPEDREQVERLHDLIDAAENDSMDDYALDEDSARLWAVGAVETALREFANPTPPKPPADVTARVTDNRDNIWRLLADGEWVCTSGPDIGEYLEWDRLASERGPVEVMDA